jgi:putative serine protease PepD
MSTFESNNSNIEVAPASARKRAGMGLAGKVAAGALILSMGFGCGAYVTNAGSNQALADSSTTATATATDSTSTDGDSTLAETVAAKVMPSIGEVSALVYSSGSLGVASGSCVVVDSEGYLVTNYHIIEGYDEIQGQDDPVIQVTIGGTTYDATVVGTDPTSDIALLKIDPGDDTLTAVTFGDSSELKAGSWVMTVGHPKGEETSVSVGVVSGVDRSSSISLSETTAYYTGVIQSDAMINSGSSGGAMVNSDGEFVGMTTYSATDSGDWAGMSYAIPSNYIKSAIEQLRTNGSVAHPQLGVSVADMSTYYNAYYSYYGSYSQSNNTSTLKGAYVMTVVEGSGAETAGIQKGDIITALDGDSVSDANSLIVAIRKHSIGDTVTVTIERDGESQDLQVTLGSDSTEDASTASTDDSSSDSTDDSSSASTDDSSSDGSSVKSVFDYIFGGGSSSDSGSSDDSSSDDSSSSENSGSDSNDNSGYGNAYGGYGYGNGYGYGAGYGYGNGGYGYGSGYGAGYGYYGSMGSEQTIGSAGTAA